MNEDRVSVEIRTGDTAWPLITSREQAEHFRNLWIEVNPMVVLSIKGVTLHTDANEVEYDIKKEDITGVMVQEIKV